ncbi:hypothetical protein SNE26_21975 [Mucilaginibacter sp. cycad4]|uniref:hypothetical protein n=1 Tax=Mucilaginibacter sp. cycad4 TaxID=3342096 RepID=UPI002AAAC66D|nr:hypothetical protein [Mucilaginibacter gossypii]WPU98689.1 hypothetical protein SNE26_21975 [Mucilaginibacter gossypii]
MKKNIVLIFILFLSQSIWAQSYKSPAITTAFADSLKNQITNIIPKGYTIRLSYQSKISTEGKLLKPLITRQFSEDSFDNNAIIQKLRFLIKEAPAWNPARDASNNAIEGMVLFDVEINKGNISIIDKTQ